MSVCEKCWADATRMSFSNGKSITENYVELLKEREDNPCSEDEQRGEARETKEREDG